MNANRLALVIVVAAVLVGCTDKPVLLNESPEGMIVRYDPNRVTATEAAAAAQAACAKYGKHAVQGATGLTGEVFTTFSCEK